MGARLTNHNENAPDNWNVMTSLFFDQQATLSAHHHSL
jgi:hypothetical protein